jgi:hypothetical protein
MYYGMISSVADHISCLDTGRCTPDSIFCHGVQEVGLHSSSALLATADCSTAPTSVGCNCRSTINTLLLKVPDFASVDMALGVKGKR